MADEDSHSSDSSVSSEGHSDPLRVAAEEGARMSALKMYFYIYMFLATMIAVKLHENG